MKVPLTSYKMQSGQTSEQTSWFAGRVNGSKGVTLSPDAFCEMGLVHSVKPALGDRLYVNVEKVKSSARTCFTFLCTHADEKFEMFQLVNSSLENQKEPVDAKETSPVMTSALKRIELLESTLAGVLLRLNAMQSDSRTSRNDASNYTAPAQTLPEVLAWVAENDRITVAELRARLLPLDLLPSAVINEINEKALDQMSELALEEVGDEIAVIKEILDEVLANWDAGKS